MPEYYQTSREERAIIFSLSTSGGEDDAQMRLAELKELAFTAGATVVAEQQQSRRAPDMSTYIGPGKAEELAQEVKALQADMVIFDDELTPSQQRNLLGILETKVVDRTQLILD